MRERTARAVAALSCCGSTPCVLCDDALHAEHLAAAVGSHLDLPTVAVRTHDPAMQ